MGFLGKVIVEKLLRSCPGIDKIYLLARSKKDKSIDDRLEEVIKSPAFDILREKNPEALNKITLVEGDISEDDLGMSQVDRTMLCDNVSVIIHCAATINFNEPLKVAVKTNLQSVKEMLTLARGVSNLKVSHAKKIFGEKSSKFNYNLSQSFVHVSTAYTNWFELDVKEQFYSTEYDPNDLIQLCRTMDQKTLDKVSHGYSDYNECPSRGNF
jgi:fatty acyl-CoA reductase